MICPPCREALHGECKGLRHPTYCDCQHKAGFRQYIAWLSQSTAAYRAISVSLATEEEEDRG